ncbi:CoA-binding protein [Tropicimonas sp. IMCC6043]|uniref:CoA-binding protein n=1 Tax=Tropicimonas sp. IMCC6043 TaxID=2510645 RepID=UPI00101BDDAA|nr:CoA-binding protein [Tropicimonas sp. IMCC6043]RYH09020.1 CoA-binding protein [Tropicimonas sp. IMCC6043]
MTDPDPTLRAVLERTRTIACVGASANPTRPSHYVSRFLVDRGYRVIGVNPGLAGQTLFGETVVASLSDITDPVDMVDIFRRSEEIPATVAAALAHLPGLGTIWMQLGLANAEAAALARAQGVDVIENRCPMIDIPRLFPPGWRVA